GDLTLADFMHHPPLPFSGLLQAPTGARAARGGGQGAPARIEGVLRWLPGPNDLHHHRLDGGLLFVLHHLSGGGAEAWDPSFARYHSVRPLRHFSLSLPGAPKGAGGKSRLLPPHGSPPARLRRIVVSGRGGDSLC